MIGSALPLEWSCRTASTATTPRFDSDMDSNSDSDADSDLDSDSTPTRTPNRYHPLPHLHGTRQGHHTPRFFFFPALVPNMSTSLQLHSRTRAPAHLRTDSIPSPILLTFVPCSPATSLLRPRPCSAPAQSLPRRHRLPRSSPSLSPFTMSSLNNGLDTGRSHNYPPIIAFDYRTTSRPGLPLSDSSRC